MKQISYIFKSGRLQRLDKDTQYPTEFYYSLKYFQNKYPNLNIIEDIDALNSRYTLIDKILQKINLPIYLSKIVSKENLKKIKNSDVVFSTNPGLAITLSPFIKKYKKKKKIKFITINSGIFTNIYGSKIGRNIFKNFFVTMFLKVVDIIIFTSKSEHKIISNLYRDFNSKFVYQSFSIDTDFWSTTIIKSEHKDGILFIGNDGNRDFSKAIEIANNLPDIEFKFVTNQINKSEKLGKNITLIKGDWNENLLTDLEIKNLYKNSRLVILPIKDQLVASGQSVAMQSMATGTPVIISKTLGFWDYENFIDNKNIFLQEDDSIESWADKVNEIYNNYDLLDKISKNGHDLIINKFNLNVFSHKLEEIFNKY